MGLSKARNLGMLGRFRGLHADSITSTALVCTSTDLYSCTAKDPSSLAQWRQPKRGTEVHAGRSPTNSQQDTAVQPRQLHCVGQNPGWPEEQCRRSKSLQGRSRSQPQDTMPGAQRARAVSLSRLSMWPAETGMALHNRLMNAKQGVAGQGPQPAAGHHARRTTGTGL